ncbi:MAG: hypothetical protein J6Z40_01510 [Oscillospiraceae bacterium]|nr:hypothetical protein [Oscillospiraceae bacterium]
MWNQQTDRMFLDMREDAVLIFDRNTLKLLYLNQTASKYFPDTNENTVYSDLFQNEKIDNLLKTAAASGRTIPLPLDEHPWFPESAVLHAVCTTWEGQDVNVLAIDKRAYGPPPEAMQMMKAVLTSAYFTSVRLDSISKRASIIIDKNPLMNTQALFPSFTEYFEKYAEAVIHPEDREQFLASFSEEQIRLFLEANTSPTCTVRRAVDEEYRWASFTLAALNQSIVLLFGKDSNEQHLVQERSDRYRSELETVSLRNSYILTGVGDMFRLMLHIDLRTNEVVVCSVIPDLASFFSMERIYQFEEIAGRLMQLVHPDDREKLHILSDPRCISDYIEPNENKISLIYRRISPHQDPNVNFKWTRSVFTVIKTEEGSPVEAVYAVQDIDAQRRKEIAAQRAQRTLTEQFYTLIRNRYIWFIDNDYSKQISLCYRIANHMVMPPMECPFGQFFERMIMPHCHPEDYKKVAIALLPLTAEENYRQGKRQISIDYRDKSETGWRFVRAEMYLQKDEDGVLHTMIYVSDVDDEVTSRNNLTRSEHEQLEMHRKFDHIISDTFLHVGEVDLDADTIRHYQLDDETLIPDADTKSFRDYCEHYADRFVHPDQRIEFKHIFSYDHILKAARENSGELKRLFLIDPAENGVYLWCNIGIKFLTNENGKNFALTYIENVNDEIQNRDSHLLSLQQKKEQLLTNLRNNERARIRRAHVFMNIASSFQLALNQIYCALDKLERDLPEDARRHHDTGLIFAAYERLSAMTACTKDLLLLENNQLPLLCEPTSLQTLMQKMRLNSKDLFEKKKIRFYSYTAHVTDEVILCDSRRLSFLVENIFFNIIRSLPDESEIMMRLAETPIEDKEQGMYEFSLMMQGDSVSLDIQSGILSPIPKNDPMKSVEAAFFLNNPDYQQYNIYLSKRLISIMGGTLEFKPLPDHSSAVVLRVPFTYQKNNVIFPLRRTFGKRALVWDSQQVAALATIEMLRESGMQCEWQSDLEGIYAYLKLAETQESPYELIVLRQSDINFSKENCIPNIREVSPSIAIIIIDDVHTEQQMQTIEAERIYEVKTPVFRSEMANVLRQVYGEPSAADTV